MAAADVASPRSVTAYAIAPIALAMVMDRVVTVIRRNVLAGQKPSAWSTLARAAAAAARIAGQVLLHCLRFALATPETAQGLRPIVLARAARNKPGADRVRIEGSGIQSLDGP